MEKSELLVGGPQLEHPKGSGFGGKYTRLPSGFRERLSKALPEEAIKPHPTFKHLSTIKSAYVLERLNTVFGINGWDFESEIIKEETVEHEVNRKVSGKSEKQRVKVNKLHVVVVGRLYFREFDLYGPIQYGSHDDEMKNMGNAFKGAVTDCLSKCASIVEIGIQVFKGHPDDRTPNKTMRLDENIPSTSKEKSKPHEEPETPPVEENGDPNDMGSDAKPEAMKKPDADKEEVSKKEEEEEVDQEFEDLKEKHEELFGKKPNANVKKENLKNKIEKEEARLAEEAEQEEEEEEEQKEEASNKAPFGGEEEEEEEELSDFEKFKNEIDSYTSQEKLGEEAGDLMAKWKKAELSPEEIKELRGFTNKKFESLNNE